MSVGLDSKVIGAPPSPKNEEKKQDIDFLALKKEREEREKASPRPIASSKVARNQGKVATLATVDESRLTAVKNAFQSLFGISAEIPPHAPINSNNAPYAPAQIPPYVPVNQLLLYPTSTPVNVHFEPLPTPPPMMPVEVEAQEKNENNDSMTGKAIISVVALAALLALGLTLLVPPVALFLGSSLLLVQILLISTVSLGIVTYLLIDILKDKTV